MKIAHGIYAKELFIRESNRTEALQNAGIYQGYQEKTAVNGMRTYCVSI